MPIHRGASSGLFFPRLIHQGTRHGYTGGVPNTAGYGGDLQASRIAQPSSILTGRSASSSRFPQPWTLEAPIGGWRKLQYFSEPPVSGAWNKLMYEDE